MEYTIGQFSLASRLTLRALRLYQEEAILVPARIDAATGYRYYTDSQLDKARLVRKLRDWNFSLTEIRSALRVADSDEDLAPFLEAKLQETRSELATLRQRQQALAEILKSIKEDTVEQSNNIGIKALPAFLVAASRVKAAYGDYGRVIAPLYKRYGKFVDGKAMAFHYDSEYREEDADYEVAFPVRRAAVDGADGALAGQAGAPGWSGLRTVPACRAVCLTHVGSYDTLGRSYQAILEYIQAQGFKLLGPTREIYLKGPGMFFRGNPARYVTEIQFPVQE